MTKDKRIKFYNFTYRKKRITIGYCDYENFEWYVSKEYGHIILYMSKDYNIIERRKILHKIIREIS